MAEAKAKRAPSKSAAKTAKKAAPKKAAAPRAKPASSKARPAPAATPAPAKPSPPAPPSPLPALRPLSPLSDAAPAAVTAPPAGTWEAVPSAAPPSLSPVSPGFSAPPPTATHKVRGLQMPLIVLVALHVILGGIAIPLTKSADATPSAGVVIVGLVANGVSVAAAVVFCIWLYRILTNVEVQQPLSGVHPGWAVGSFFVPLVHLVAPYFEVRRGWIKQVAPGAGLVTAWFVPWSLSIVAAYVTAFVSVSSTFGEAFKAAQDGSEPATASQPEWLWMLSAASVALQAIAAVFLALMVRRWTAIQDPKPA